MTRCKHCVHWVAPVPMAHHYANEEEYLGRCTNPEIVAGRANLKDPCFATIDGDNASFWCGPMFGCPLGKARAA